MAIKSKEFQVLYLTFETIWPMWRMPDHFNIISLKIDFVLANSADPDEMPPLCICCKYKNLIRALDKTV